MAEILITSGLAFAGTNMDDILILMILFAAAGSRKERLCITAGQYLGMGLLTQYCRGLRGAYPASGVYQVSGDIAHIPGDKGLDRVSEDAGMGRVRNGRIRRYGRHDAYRGQWRG